MLRWEDFLILIGALVTPFYPEVVSLILLFVFIFKAFFALVNQWRTIKPLLRLLKSLENPDQKAEVFWQVRDNEELTTLLLKGLDLGLSLSFSERVQVIETVGQLRLKEAVQPLIKLLKEFPMWEGIHSKAIWALGKIGDESIAPEIIPYLGEFNYLSVRMEVIEALHKLGWGEFVDAFNRLMLGNEEALTILRERYRSETVKALTRALWASKPSIAIAAANALGKLNAFEALKELKRRCNPIQSPREVRQVCREVVAKLEQFSRLPSPACSEIDASTLPRPVDPSAFQSETLPSPAKSPDETIL